MPANPPLTLAEAEQRGFFRIRLACPKCGGRGDYAVRRLRERFGACRMIVIREALWADCERHKTIGSSFPEACGARFEW